MQTKFITLASDFDDRNSVYFELGDYLKLSIRYLNTLNLSGINTERNKFLGIIRYI